MIAVTNFILLLPELGDFPRGDLELVDRLDSHRIHGFAQRSATVVEEFIACPVRSELAADFCVLRRKICKRDRTLSELRSLHTARDREVYAVAVVEPVGATRDPPLVLK